jgi:hypothetical protein
MKKNLPPYLYKYQPYNIQTLDNIKDRYIWFSKPDDFNDPFDCSINFSFDDLTEIDWEYLYQKAREAWEKNKESNPSMAAFFAGDEPSPNFKKVYSENLKARTKIRLEKEFKQRGVACFSEKVDDVLMWSHYSDGHRGFCLEYDTRFLPFSKAVPVEYSEAYPTINPTQDINNLLIQLATTKSIGWEYEKEWRIFYEMGNKEFGVAVDALTGIYLGCEMPYVHKEVIALVLRDAPTKLYEARISETNFEIEFEQVEYTPYDYSKRPTQ